MRTSPLKHNLARLRLLLKLGQKEMAREAGCSTRTIQSVELGTLALSESLARKISDATSVSAGWLLDNDPKAPLITFDGRPFTLENYDERRSLRGLGLPTIEAFHASFVGDTTAMVFYAWMRSIFAAKDADIAVWKTGKFLETLASDHGHNRDILPARPRLQVAALRDHQVRCQQAEIGMRLAEKYTRKWRKGKLRRGKHGGLDVSRLLRKRATKKRARRRAPSRSRSSSRH